MIILNQPGLKSFITYVFSFIFLTLFIYLGIPFFFDYESNKLDLEKKIFENFGLNLHLTSKAKYNIFPSPRLNLKNVEILGFSESSKNIGSVKKVILKIPFKSLVSLKKLDFDSIELIDAVINIKTSEINNFKNYLNNEAREKPIQLTKSKIKVVKPATKYKSLMNLVEKQAFEFQRVRIKNQESEFIGLNKLKDLLSLKERPRVLECYDVAIWQGKSPTAAQIVFHDGNANKKLYRHYNLQERPEGNNDYAMMKELLERRVEHGNLPDLFIVDGGLGQVNVFRKVLS